MSNKPASLLPTVNCISRRGKKVVDIGFSPSENYWTEFVASLYQWLRNVTYKEIFSQVTANDFLCMYPTFNEEDIANVLEEIDRRLEKNEIVSWLDRNHTITLSRQQGQKKQ